MTTIFRITTGIEYDAEDEYIPSDYRNDVINHMQKQFSELFGGVTVYYSSGAWLDNGELIKEESATFEIHTTVTQKTHGQINLLATELKNRLNQKVVLVYSITTNTYSEV